MNKLIVTICVLLAIGLFAFGVHQGTQTAEADFQDFTVGSTLATGATITVTLGWLPRSVVVSRVSATAANNYQATLVTGMTGSTSILHGPSALTYITTGGLMFDTGSTTRAPGFKIGTNASLNNSGDTLFWQAWR